MAAIRTIAPRRCQRFFTGDLCQCSPQGGSNKVLMPVAVLREGDKSTRKAEKTFTCTAHYALTFSSGNSRNFSGKAMTRRWGILLEGDETELRRWELAFSAPFDPYVSIEQRGHVLWCTELQAEKNSSEVWQATKALMDQANSIVVHCQGPSNVKCAGILEVQQNGQQSVHAFAEVHINESIFFEVTMSATVIDKNGNLVVQEPQETTAQKWMRVAATSDRLGDALIYGLRRESWFDLYKAYEAIELHYGGEHRLKSLNWVEPKQRRSLQADRKLLPSSCAR